MDRRTSNHHRGKRISNDIERVAHEIEAALATFTADGYAEEIGFDAGPEGIWAEIYGDEGAITKRLKITFAITEEEQ